MGSRLGVLPALARELHGMQGSLEGRGGRDVAILVESKSGAKLSGNAHLGSSIICLYWY